MSIVQCQIYICDMSTPVLCSIVYHWPQIWTIVSAAHCTCVHMSPSDVSVTHYYSQQFLKEALWPLLWFKSCIPLFSIRLLGLKKKIVENPPCHTSKVVSWMYIHWRYEPHLMSSPSKILRKENWLKLLVL